LIFKATTAWEQGDPTEAERKSVVRALAEAEATMQSDDPALSPHAGKLPQARMTCAARLCLLVAGEAVVAAIQTGDPATAANFCDLYNDLTVADGEFLLRRF